MECQDQKPIETLEPQVLESLEESQEKSCVTPSYRAPQVVLVGKAKRLVAGSYYDYNYDYDGYYYY